MKIKPRVAPLVLAVLTVVGVAGAGFALANPGAITTTDAVTRSTRAVFLDPTGGVETTILSLTLPAGDWIVHADDSAVGVNQPSDVVRCFLVAPGVHVGHATEVGNGQHYPLVATVSGTIGLSLAASTTVTNTCLHDNSTGGTYRIDAGATMSAHKAQSLTLNP